MAKIMTRKIWFLGLLCFVSLGSVTASANELSAQDIRDRLELRADIYVLDATGKKVISGPERTNYWRPSLETGVLKGDWSSNFGSRLIIAMKYDLQVQDDGSLKVTIEEYGSVGDKRSSPELKNLLEHREFVLQNFEPIVWKVKNIKGANWVVRYIPSLREVSKPVALDSLPIAGSGISVSDNSGYLWAEDVQFNGKYSGLTSHRGTLALSYVPFAGAKEMGFAEGNQITISVDKKFQINLKSSTSFLPAGVTAKVYAVYLPEKKSKGFNSLHTFDTSKVERVQEVLKE